MIGHLHITAIVDGHRIAIPIDHVAAAIRIGKPVPVPLAGPAIGGLVALRSNVLTLIDCRALLCGTPRMPAAGDLAVVVKVGGYSYGLVVDDVHDVLEISPSDISGSDLLDQPWRTMATGIAEQDAGAVIVVDPDAMIAHGNTRDD